MEYLNSYFGDKYVRENTTGDICECQRKSNPDPMWIFWEANFNFMTKYNFKKQMQP